MTFNDFQFFFIKQIFLKLYALWNFNQLKTIFSKNSDQYEMTYIGLTAFFWNIRVQKYKLFLWLFLTNSKSKFRYFSWSGLKKCCVWISDKYTFFFVKKTFCMKSLCATKVFQSFALYTLKRIFHWDKFYKTKLFRFLMSGCFFRLVVFGTLYFYSQFSRKNTNVLIN